MSYHSRVGGIPDPFGYRIEGAQERQTGGSPPEEPPKDNKGLIAFLIQTVKSAIARVVDQLGGSVKKPTEEALNALKAALNLLKTEDHSQDVRFLNRLAECWNRALEESLDYPEAASLIFKLFVKKMMHYPENQPHTFGYYLTEYAGQKWVPFPYMELVQKIHQEHQRNPAGSALTEWTRLLDDTVHALKGQQ